MKNGLIDMDNISKKRVSFPNLPLMKLSAYHKKHGDCVDWWVALEKYDLVYKSKVFDFTPEIEYPIYADRVVEGGSGYGLDNHLPDEVEHIMPDYSLYPQFNAAYGFLTRGCPRACPFCIVAPKEGTRSVKVADLSDARGGFHGLYIELKRQKGSKTSDDQKAWLSNLEKQGYFVALCKGWEAAAKVITEYLTMGGKEG